jgi:hypothetical protein
LIIRHLQRDFAKKFVVRLTYIVSESGAEVQYLKKRGIRKESLVAEILKKRGEHSGIVCILSTLECCNTCKPWHDRQTGKTFLTQLAIFSSQKPPKSQKSSIEKIYIAIIQNIMKSKFKKSVCSPSIIFYNLFMLFFCCTFAMSKFCSFKILQ